MERLRPLLVVTVLALMALVAITRFQPLLDPDAGIAVSISSDEATQRAKDLVTRLGIAAADMDARASLTADRPLIRQMQSRHGFSAGNELLRSSLPAYRWQVRFARKDPKEFRIGAGPAPREADALRGWLLGDLTVQLDGHGRVLGIERGITDTAALRSTTPDSAKILATSALRGVLTDLQYYAGVSAETIAHDSSWIPRRIDQRARTDYEYSWSLQNAPSGNPLRVTVHVAGSIVSKVEAEIEAPEEFQKDTRTHWQGIASVIVWVVIVVAMLVISFRRFRAYEIGFRMATVMGIASGVMVAFEIWQTVAGRNGWEMYVPIVLGSIFYGGALIMTWAVSESVVRETWREKMVSLDLLVNGYIAHSRVGASVVAGICLGIIAHGIDLSVLAGLTRVVPVVFFAEESSGTLFSVSSPTAYVLTHALYSSTYMAAFFVLFLISWTHRNIRPAWLALLVPSIAIVIARSAPYEPVWVAPTVVVGSSVMFVVALKQFDALAAYLTIFTMLAVRQAGLLHITGGTSFQSSSIILCAIAGVAVLGGLIAQFRKSELKDFEAITPAFAKHITERERLKHELDIARTVQMSFLPKKSPDIPRLDVAARCEPALEVGGDYYDFFRLKDGKWGIAVGDVSGKGTQAAFFMTLTKGFLRALAQTTSSPADVLKSVNRHFYENVERGVFISLVYGVFDPEKATMTLARAGHNPVMRFRNGMTKAEIVSSTGLALGMDPGQAFDSSIQETVLACHFGDAFVFYTDGISEAMNKAREEFGDNRLAVSIAQHGHGPALHILDGIFADVKTFAGRERAHDDKTMVVLKVV